MNVKLLLDGQYWSSLFSSPWASLIHLLDIALVVYVIYYFTKAVAGTKIMTLIRGVIFFLLVQVVATALRLQTITWLMNQIITYGVIAGVVVFAPELRTVLEKLGRTAQLFTGGVSMSSEERLIQSLLHTVYYLVPRKIGALIAVERTQTLQEYASTGIGLDAQLSSELLINIFIPNTPLHDGAVIVRNGRVAVSCAYLPLTDNATISKEFGTRHRAAIGLSEVSDAFVLVVSEETGDLSVAKDGAFYHHLNKRDLERLLRETFVEEEQRPVWWKRWGGH